MRRFPPGRIICLTEETVETLYLLGQDHRIVGVSGYAVRPKRVRREKPRVSAFTSADIPGILALEPDLVLTFSDLQADIAAELLKRGVTVIGTNQRDIAGIFAMIRMLGALTGSDTGAATLVSDYERRLAKVQAGARGRTAPGAGHGIGRRCCGYGARRTTLRTVSVRELSRGKARRGQCGRRGTRRSSRAIHAP